MSAWFVPTVVGAALLTFIAWLLFGPAPALAYALSNSVAVLIIACPCALGLATPISIMVASGRAAQLGVLFRYAKAIESLRQIQTLVVDKTGTLTTGRPALQAVVTVPPWSESELLALAAGAERSSEHPLARAIMSAAAERGVTPRAISDFEALGGAGVRGKDGNRAILIGNDALMLQERVNNGTLLDRADALLSTGSTVVFVAVDGVVAGLMAIGDPVKASTPGALAALRADGLRVVMLTGDARATAEAVGKTLGINDAPALARADVGIAMGTGTDIAMESAQVTLVKGDLNGIVRARELSRAAVRNIRQNLGFAFGYNLLGIPIAAGVLFPALGLLLNPMIAALAMSLSSVSVIGNALRLRRRN